MTEFLFMVLSLTIISWVSLPRGNGSSGTGTSRKAQSGSQPSLTSKTKSWD